MGGLDAPLRASQHPGAAFSYGGFVGIEACEEFARKRTNFHS